MNKKTILLLAALASVSAIYAEEMATTNDAQMTDDIGNETSPETSPELADDDFDFGDLGIDVDNFDPENPDQMDAFIKALENNPKALAKLQEAAAGQEDLLEGTPAEFSANDTADDVSDSPSEDEIEIPANPADEPTQESGGEIDEDNQNETTEMTPQQETAPAESR